MIVTGDYVLHCSRTRLRIPVTVFVDVEDPPRMPFIATLTLISSSLSGVTVSDGIHLFFSEALHLTKNFFQFFVCKVEKQSITIAVY